MINASLSDERIGETSLASKGKKFCSKHASSPPVTIESIEDWKLRDKLADCRRQFRVAEKLGQDNWRQGALFVFEDHLHHLNIFSFGPREISDERTGVNRDHSRSSRSFFRFIEKLTFPRRLRSFSYASLAATSSNPLRTVAVTPLPVELCALRSRSSGICTVIFRFAPMKLKYQHGCHNTIWHLSLLLPDPPAAASGVWTFYASAGLVPAGRKIVH